MEKLNILPNGQWSLETLKKAVAKKAPNPDKGKTKVKIKTEKIKDWADRTIENPHGWTIA